MPAESESKTRERPEVARVLSAPYVLEYTYRRSVGPVIGRFLAGLRDRKIEGIRTMEGKVLVPPVEYDPASGEALSEFVEVAESGVVTTWAWMEAPRKGQPLDRPFAWALIKLDGADTALLHAVDARSMERMATGMRVRVRWSSTTVGAIQDIACFEVVNDGGGVRLAERAPIPLGGAPMSEPVRRIKAPVSLPFTVTAGRSLSRFLAAIAEGRFVGKRCPGCRKVYVPPRGACPSCGVGMTEEVPVADTGTLTTFCVVNVPVEGRTIKLPYVYGSILLDGADIPLYHLIQGLPVPEVRMGLRVQAEWAPPDDRRPTMESILWFRPTGEPDALFETYKEHL